MFWYHCGWPWPARWQSWEKWKCLCTVFCKDLSWSEIWPLVEIWFSNEINSVQGSKFPPVRLPGTSRFSVRQPKTLSPLALWAIRFWVQLLVKRCQPKAVISFSSTVGLVSCKPTPFQPFLSHFHLLHSPQLCSLTEKAKLSRWGAWRPRAHSMVSLVIIDLDRKYFVTCAREGAGEWYLAS